MGVKKFPSYLEYAFLEGDSKLPIIVVVDLDAGQKERLLKMLKRYKELLLRRLQIFGGLAHHSTIVIFSWRMILNQGYNLSEDLTPTCRR